MKLANSLLLLSSLSLKLSLCAQTAIPSPTGGSQFAEPYRVTDTGPDHRVWSMVSWETNHIGELVPRTNSYVELATGLHYRDSNSQEWRESDPSFELTPEGHAVARRCQHQVIISPNLNTPDGIVVDLLTPDGQRLRSGIVGLNLFDPVSGKGLQIGAIRDVVGTQVSSNEIVWFDAFDGLKADVRVRNERGQFHQDVLLREKLSATQLASLGFDANTVRIEVWTEFLEAPDPLEQRIVLKTETNAAVRATMADPDEVDHVLKFGSEMQIGPGSAFIEGEPDKTTRVFKQWQETGGRRFLIETIRYRELLPLLEALPVKTAALNAGRTTSGLAANRPPPERAKPSSADASKALWIAKLDSAAPPPSSPHVVLDYPLSGGYTDYTLRGDTTYYISGYVGLSGTSSIEGGTVVKFAPYNPGVYLQFNGTVRCLTGPYRPAIFTARDDNTVGEVISGSTGNPAGYYAQIWCVTVLAQLRDAARSALSGFDVGYFENHGDKLVSVQLVLIDRSNIAAPGDFDMEFNYCKVRWEAGDVSGGCGGFWTGFSCTGQFFGGSPTRAGFASAGGSSFELAGSGVPGAFLDSNLTTGLVYHSFNSANSGRYVFQFRSGVPLQTP